VIAGSSAAVVGSAIEVSLPRSAAAQTKLSPDAAIRALVAGNQRFATDRSTASQRDLDLLKARTVEKQEPFAAVLACADSRVPVEMIFDQTISDLFVTRVAGNVVTPEITASLEYAVAVLGVKAVVVLGHSNCGAVKAALKGEDVPGQISSLYVPLHRAVEQSGGDYAKAISINARVQADLLRTSSTVIHQADKASKIKVTYGVYDLASGRVTLA
jgi:carbonic anhydrase